MEAKRKGGVESPEPGCIVNRKYRVYSIECKHEKSWPLTDAHYTLLSAPGCGGRSYQSDSGEGGVASTAGGRGVAESRVVPEDADLPGARAAGGESLSRSRCSARIRTRPEPLKSTSG